MQKEGMKMAEAKKTAAAAKPDYEHELVDLMLPINTANPKDDTLTLIINGEATVIQRGKQVKIPRYKYEAIMNAEEQKLRAYSRKQEAETMTAKAQSAQAI